MLWDLFATCLAVHDYAKAEKTASDALSISSTALFFILARAAVALFRNGDTAPLRAALKQVARPTLILVDRQARSHFAWV